VLSPWHRSTQFILIQFIVEAGKKTLLPLAGMIMLGTIIAPTQRKQAGRQTGKQESG